MALDTPQVYCRNILEVIKSLFGNPKFDEEMHFRVERIYNNNKKRFYNKIWITDWWWDV
jgi:Plavaka transposase